MGTTGAPGCDIWLLKSDKGPAAVPEAGGKLADAVGAAYCD